MGKGHESRPVRPWGGDLTIPRIVGHFPKRFAHYEIVDAAGRLAAMHHTRVEVRSFPNDDQIEFF